MIADRHPLVVRQQRVVGAEQAADGGGVVDRRCRSRCSRRPAPARAYSASACGTRQGCHVCACGAPSRSARDNARRSADHAFGPIAMKRFSDRLGRGVQRGAATRRRQQRRARAIAARSTICVADRDAAAPRLVAAVAAKHGERQVLDREVACRPVGRSHPAAQRRVVGFVEGRHGEAYCGASSQAAVMHPRGVLGRAPGPGPLVEHVPLHLVELLHHLGRAGVGRTAPGDGRSGRRSRST